MYSHYNSIAPLGILLQFPKPAVLDRLDPFLRELVLELYDEPQYEYRDIDSHPSADSTTRIPKPIVSPDRINSFHSHDKLHCAFKDGEGTKEKQEWRKVCPKVLPILSIDPVAVLLAKEELSTEIQP